MQAITQDKYGSADVLQLRDIDQPNPGDHEVVVSVQAAGIARGVLHVMTGEPYLMRLVGFGLLNRRTRFRARTSPGPSPPPATGSPASTSVTRSSVSPRAHSPSTPSPARTSSATNPTNLSFEQAAAMPISGLTALRALDAAGVAAGSNVLVVGASGGVGTYAVQIAVALGATVTGVASGSKADLVTALGARHVIDYTREDFADGSHTLRRGRGHRRHDACVASAPGTSTEGDSRHRGRGKRQQVESRHGSPAEGGRDVTLRLATADVDLEQGALLRA